MQKLNSSLTLKNLILHLYIGAYEIEKSQKQEIKADISINFINPPFATTTDNLADTVCYDILVKKIQDFALTKHFNLLENFTYSLFEFLKTQIIFPHTLTVTVTKPLVNKSLENSIFTVADGV